MPITGIQPGLKPGSLSFTYDTLGHRIDRYPGNVLAISHVTGRRITDDEKATVTRWYWQWVAVQGNDPHSRKE